MISNKILLILSLIFSFSIYAQKEKITISTLLKNYNGKRPGISYAIIKNGKVLDKNNLGFANIEKSKIPFLNIK